MINYSMGFKNNVLGEGFKSDDLGFFSGFVDLD